MLKSVSLNHNFELTKSFILIFKILSFSKFLILITNYKYIYILLINFRNTVDPSNDKPTVNPTMNFFKVMRRFQIFINTNK